jgi:formate dehydrogenase maturation protein FdhE
MRTVQEIESAIERLSEAEKREVQEWLENLLEDRMELREEFKASIETSEREMAQRRQGG